MPIVVPMRERWLVVGCFFVVETDGVLRLFEASVREDTLERAAGCVALLGTDGLVVLMLVPTREVKSVLILLLVLLVERFVITLLELLKFKLLLLELLKLDVLLLELLLLVIALLELLLLGVRFVTTRLELLRLLAEFDRLFVLVVDLTVGVLELRIELFELMLLPIREVKLELILLFDLLCCEDE